MMRLSSSTVTSPAHTETMTPGSCRFSSSSSSSSNSTARACWSSKTFRGTLAQVIQERTLLARSRRPGICPSIRSMASSYARFSTWSFWFSPTAVFCFCSCSRAFLTALGVALSRSDWKRRMARRNLGEISKVKARKGMPPR